MVTPNGYVKKREDDHPDFHQWILFFSPKFQRNPCSCGLKWRDGSISSKALQIHGSRPDVVEALAGQCLQHLDAVFSALGEVNRWGLQDFFWENIWGESGGIINHPNMEVIQIYGGPMEY